MSTVLVVEDDPDTRLTVRTLLEDEGLETVEAANGRIALDLLTAGLAPKLIVLDLVMPGMDGVELLKILKVYSRLSTIKVLILSAYNPAYHPSTAHRFDDYLSKPMAPGAFMVTVRRLLGRDTRLA